MDAPAAAAIAGLAPFRVNRRPGLPGGRAPGEPPFGGADHAPVWLESFLRLAMHALWAAAAAAGGSQLTPALVGGAGAYAADQPQVARMVERLEALIAAAEDGGGLGRAAVADLRVWAHAAMVLGVLAITGIGLWRVGGWLTRNSIGARARALMELSVVLEQGGEDAAAHMAQAAGVSEQEVYDWHAAWKAAWRGPG